MSFRNLITRLQKAKSSPAQNEAESVDGSSSGSSEASFAETIAGVEKGGEVEDVEVEGIELPSADEFDPSKASSENNDEDSDEDYRDIEKKYPLIPEDPNPNETVYAWAHIKWDEEEQDLVYEVIEPEKNRNLENVLDRIKHIIEKTLDRNFEELTTQKAEKYLENRIEEIVDKYEIKLTSRQLEIVKYYAKRDFVGLGKLQPLMNDKEVEDISCDGSDLPVYVYHRDPKLGSIKTTIQWKNDEELDKFVMKLAQRCGKSISVSNPLLDGSLPDGSRVQATLATDIARKGSNFTIRRFTEDPLTPVHMMEFETETPRMMSYLWTLVENEKSILVAGTTGAGKTSQLNALSLFIKPEKKIVSIEDTPELRLPHEHWVPQVARSGFGSSANSTGEVSMDDLLKESLRQRPEYIIVGEVRGEEAYILFQQMATGHTGLSTIHADTMDMLQDRLTTQPIDLSPALIETLDAVMLVARIRRGDKYIRRIKGIYEIEEYEERRGLQVNQTFDWNAADDEYVWKNDSILLKEIVENSGMEEVDMKKELVGKQKVLQWMMENDLKHYRDVGDTITRYYSDRENLLNEVQKNLDSNNLDSIE